MENIRRFYALEMPEFWNILLPEMATLETFPTLNKLFAIIKTLSNC